MELAEKLTFYAQLANTLDQVQKFYDQMLCNISQVQGNDEEINCVNKLSELNQQNLQSIISEFNKLRGISIPENNKEGCLVFPLPKPKNLNDQKRIDRLLKLKSDLAKIYEKNI